MKIQRFFPISSRTRWYLAILFLALIFISCISCYILYKKSETEMGFLQRLRECNPPHSRTCVNELIVAAYKLKGKDFTLWITALASKDEDLLKYCHLMTHALGKELLKDIRNPQKALAESSSLCGGGMVHGIMEVALGDEQVAFRRQKSTQLTSSMKDICSNLTERDYKDTLKRCYHGFGHFVMNLTNQDVLKALPLCDQISDPKYTTDCYTGALMQNFDPNFQDDHKAIYFSAGPPHAFCANLEERYRGTCYQYAVLTSSMKDSKESIERCMRVPNEYIEGCIGNYGANRVAYTRDLHELKRLCDIVPPGLFLQCIVPLATQIGKNSSSEPERIELFCNQLPQEKQDTCVRSGIYGLLSTLKIYSEVPNNITSICKRHEVECSINKL